MSEFEKDKLEVVRHSCAHVMAEAVKALYPGVKIAIGPAIDNGFYYDFDFPSGVQFSQEDFPAVEKQMRAIIQKNVDFERKEVSRAEALELFKDEPYKTELINDLPEGDVITTYTQDGYLDLCRGPHVTNTKEINAQAFCLDRVAGAYWRGSSDNKMLTRIYALCFLKPQELKDYKARILEAEKRDHRKLGLDMDLFHIDSENPGQIFWHPNGWTIYTTIQEYMRRMLRKDGYEEVNTPIIMPRTLWERSGHWGHYQKNMFITESEKRLFAIKPMNCPGAIEIFKSRQRSYKDLPMRLAEFGHDTRNEASGTLHGIMRVRGFTQDDAHILCSEDQIKSEVTKFCKLLKAVYHDFGFDDLIVKFSTMPEDHVGDLSTWEHAESALKDACSESGLTYDIQPGEGAFYGPKLEFQLLDTLGRPWQCGTIQLDYQLPSAERLDATYVGSDNERHHPVMLHRAVLGTFERFMGILIENFAGLFPTWLAFEQVAVVPVGESFNDYAKKISDELIDDGIRSCVYLSSDNMRNKIKTITKEHKTPYILVVGENEEKEGTVTVRYRADSKKNQETLKLSDFASYVKDKIKTHYIGI